MSYAARAAAAPETNTDLTVAAVSYSPPLWSRLLIKAHLPFSGQLALVSRLFLPTLASTPHHVVPFRGQKTAPAPTMRSRFDNSAEFVVARLDDLVNWARKVRTAGREGGKRGG